MKIASSWVKHYLLPVAILAASVVRIYQSANLFGFVSTTLSPSAWTQLSASTTKHPLFLFPTILSSPDSNGVCNENAVIYMAQKKHSSYNRDSHALLTKSIKLLYDNYLNQQHYNNTNVFIFHAGDFNIDDLKQMEAPLSTKGLIHLVDLSNTTFWEIPEWLRGEDTQTWGAMAEFSVGYRHMVRHVCCPSIINILHVHISDHIPFILLTSYISFQIDSLAHGQTMGLLSPAQFSTWLFLQIHHETGRRQLHLLSDQI